MRRVILTLLALALLLPGTAFARTSFLCSMDGQVRSSCCCPAKAKQHEVPAVPTVRAACCCKVTTIQASSRPAATHQGSAVPAPERVAIVVVAAPVVPSIARVTPAPRALAPPDPERSLFARHCALLL